MPLFQRNDLEWEINSLKARLEYLQWLKDLNIVGRKVANFGCASGHETFALIWLFDADEIVGIDINITQAQQTLSDFNGLLERNLEAILYTRVSSEDRSWWETEVPSFLKKKLFPTFLEQDITQPTELPPNHFDVVYCSNVLYHIYAKQGSEGVMSGIEEMARVIKSGGWVVASEPSKLSPISNTPLDFRLNFEQAGLKPFREILNELTTSYLYQKPKG